MRSESAALARERAFMGQARPVLDQLSIVVGDMAASTAFYRKLGLDIQDQGNQWDDHHRTVGTEAGLGIDIDLDSTTFAPKWSEGWATGRTGVVIGFRVQSRSEVDRLYDQLTGEGHPGLQSPMDAFWGSRYAIVEDPDGNPVGVMSPADPELRTPPPDPAP
jgi:catechol 2,3-dioxygenase-like lactoylglutathione lyase family enzyme